MLFENAATASVNYVAQALLVFGFGVLLRHYFHLYRRSYLRFWSYASLYYGASVCFALLRIHLPAVEVFTLAHLSLLYLALALLAIGVFDIVHERAPRKTTRRRVYAASMSLGLLIMLPALFENTFNGWLPFFSQTLMFLVSGIALLSIGALIFSHAPPSIGPRLIASAFLLIGIKNVILVQLSFLSADMAINEFIWSLQGLLNVLFLAMAAIGITIWLLESERHRSLHALQKTEYLNTHDALTGIENREELMSKMPVFIDSSRANGRHLSMILVGLNRFKAINDAFGIRGGDRALIEVSQRLQNLPNKPLALARVSGDVFVVVFDHLKRRELVESLAQDIKRLIESPIEMAGKTFNLSCRLGVSRYPQNGIHGEALLSKANIALAQARQTDHTSILFYQRGMDENYIRLIDLEPELRKAFQRNEFVLYVQPLYNSAAQALCGFEALVRWQHPTRGLLPPSEFLPFIEELGLSSNLDDWVLDHVGAFIARWRALGHEVLPVAVNLSARHFQQPELVTKLKALFKKYELQYADLELEITENVAMTDMQAGLNVLEQLQALGIQVSIDDFGTGYSSLAYLRRLPVNKIKIDRSFITEMLADSSSSENNIVKTLIQLSHGLKKRVVAEGVENAEQLTLLTSMDCDQVQGFHLSPPVNLQAALVLLQQHWKQWKASPLGLAPIKPMPL